MNNSLLIVGAGGHGRVVADAALQLGFERIGFVDDYLFEKLGKNAATAVTGAPIVAHSRALSDLVHDWGMAISAFGDNHARASTLVALQHAGYKLPAIIHPSAILSKQAHVGKGVFIAANCVVNIGAVLEDGVIVNTGATIDHDCRIGRCAHISPGANLAGGVHIGEDSWIGIGSCVRQNISIGKDVKIGAGAVVVNDISEGMVVVGNPARPMHKQAL